MSGLYNMLYGYTMECVTLAPMLTDENPQNFFPRFRDCFISEDGERIVIFTRVGGNNRSDPDAYGYDQDWDFGESKLYAMPEFVRTWDDDFDNTYGFYEFNVPEQWREDFQRIKDNEFDKLSDAYIERVQKCYPKLDVPELIEALKRCADDSDR